jgi:hypothetical protein
MAEYVKIRQSTPRGNPIATDSPAYQAILVLLRELVQPIFAELGQEVTLELTLTITPAPRGEIANTGIATLKRRAGGGH